MSQEQFIYIFDLACLGIIFGGMLTGFIRGTKKSLFYLIFFVSFIIVGYLVMPSVAGLALKTDIAGFNLYEFIFSQLSAKIPEISALLQEDTLMMGFVDSVVLMAFRIVWILVIVILASTIWQIFIWFFWILFSKKQKKSFSNRLLGSIVGLVNGFIILLFIVIPLSGISSIAESMDYLKTTTPESEELPLSYAMTPEEGLDILTSYSKTFIGSTFKKIAINNTTIDERLFDEIVYLKFNNEKIKLRKEIIIVGNIVSNLSNHVDLQDENVLSKIMELDNDLLNEYIVQASQLKLIDVAVPVGIEYLYLTKPDLFQDIDLEKEDFDNLLKIKYQSEFENLAKSFLEAYKLIGPNIKEVNYFNLDDDKVVSILDKISQLELLEILGPMGLKYLTTIPKFSEIIDANNLDVNSIKYKEEIQNISKLYLAIKVLELNTTNLKEIDYSLIDDEKVISLADSLYGMQIVQLSTPSIINYLVNNVMTEQIKSYITPEAIRNVDWDNKEIAAVLLLSKLMMANNVLDSDFKFENLLTEAVTRPLANYMISSELIFSSLTPLIKNLMTEDQSGIFGQIVINDDYVWDEEELFSIFEVARLAKDLVTNEQIDFNNISNEYIDELTLAISNSEIIMSNMTPIFTNLTNKEELKINLSIEDDFIWTNKEINAIFKSIKIIYAHGGEVTNIFGISDDEINTFLDSKIISQTMLDYFYDYTTPGSELADVLVINLAKDDQRWYDDENTDGELRKLIKSLGLLLGSDYNLGENIDLNKVSSLDDEEITILLSSIIVNDSLKQKLISLSSPDKELNDILIVRLAFSDPKWQDGTEEGELRKFLKSFKLLFGTNFDVNNPNLDLSLIINLTDLELKQLIASEIISDSMVNAIYKLSTNELLNVIYIPHEINKYDSRWYGDEGELMAFVKGVQQVRNTDNINDITLDIKDFYDDNKTNIILNSEIFRESILKNIEKSSVANDPLIITSLRSSGELEKFIQATKILLPDGNVDLIDFSIEKVYHKTDEELEILFNSNVVSDSIYHNIEKSEVALNGSLDITNLRSEDELKKLVRALEIIISNPTTGINDANFEVNNFYKTDEELDTILASKVISDSIIQRINNSTAAINNTLDITYLAEEGELKNFIKAVQILLPADSIDNLNIDIDIVMKADLNTLLASRVMESSIINKVDPMFSEGGVLYVYMKLPEDISWARDYSTTPPTEGDLKPFLEAIQMMDNAGVNYKNINLNSITASDSNELATALLHSRIIKMSISKMLNKVLSDEGVPYNVPDQEYTHPELVAHLEEIKYWWSLIG